MVITTDDRRNADSLSGPSVRRLDTNSFGCLTFQSSFAIRASTDRIDAYVWRISAVVIVGSIMSILDTTIVNVALATLSRELHSTIAQIQWVVTGYLLSLAAVIPVTGWAARRFGAKRVYLVSLVLFTAGSALCGLATSTTELIVFRVLQGVGGGMILPIGQLMMAEAAGPKRMGRVMSIVAVPAMLAPILGPTIGGLIIDNASWRWIFYVNVPIGVIAVIAALRVPADASKREPAEPPRHPRAGADGDRAAAADLRPRRDRRHRQLHLAEGRDPDHRRRSRWSPRSSCHALRVPKPLLDLRLYRRPTFASASFAMFCLGAALFGGMILLPLYWQEIRHESVVDTGLLTAPQGLGMALVMPLAGRLTDRFGGGPLALFGVIVTHGRDDPVRADRRAHVDRVAVGRDVRARDRHRLRVHAGDGGGVRGARALRAVRRDAAAERAPARRRLDRHRGPRGRAPARAGRRPHARAPPPPPTAPRSGCRPG